MASLAYLEMVGDLSLATSGCAIGFILSQIPAILLDEIVRILDLPELDERLPLSVNGLRAARFAPLSSMLTVSAAPLGSIAFSK